jgi:sugar/nucleoside kinase (ribokinase family)
MTKTWDVIVVGSSFIDFVFTGLPEWPRIGEEVFAQIMHREIGGAAITACGLGRLGRKVALLTCLGNEDQEWFFRRLESCHVDASLVRRSPKPTAVTVSLSTSRDRSFLSYSGANAELPNLLDHEHVQRTLAQAAHIHFAMMPDHPQAQSLFRQLRGAGCSISLDVGWDEAWLRDQNTVETLRQTDFFLPNEKEAQIISGKRAPEEMLRWFTEARIGCVAVTLGNRGSVMVHGSNFYEEPSIPVDVVDTTGAGDCFNAGFLHSVLASEAPRDWLRFGNLCGALSTRALGGIAGFPTLEELEEMA